MLKLAGSVLMLCGCSAMGWYAALSYVSRIRILQEAEQVLQFLYGEIEYSGCDMLELLDKLTKRGGFFEAFFARVAKDLKQYDGSSFASLWEREMHRQKVFQCLQREDLELLTAVGQNLGNTDRFTQLHTLEIFSGRLHELTKAARAEYKEKAHVGMTVGVTAGLFLVLVFW